MNIDSVEQLKENVGQCQIVIIPNRDLPVPTNRAGGSAIVEQQTTRASTEMQRQMTQTVSEEQQQTTQAVPEVQLHTIQSERRGVVEVEDDPITIENVLINPFENEHRSNPLLLEMPTIEENAETVILTITRQNCLQEMFKLYEDEGITLKKISVLFKDKLGIDSGGFVV